MTRTEALAIVTREAPCPHESWEDMGKSVVPRCKNCRAAFTPEDHKRAQKAAEEFQRALDALAAEPGPTAAPPAPMPHPGINIPKCQPDEKFAAYQLRVLQGYFPEARISKVTGRATVDTGEGWLSLRYLDADVFAFEATFVSKEATAGEGSTGRTRKYTDPGRALAEILEEMQGEERERVKTLEFNMKKANRKADICGALRKRLEGKV